MLPSIAEIEHFLGLSDSITEMIAATNKGKPALERVIPILMKRVTGDYSDATIRRTTGRLAKKVMESRGYKVDRKKQRHKLNTGCFPFVTASRYIKR